MTGRPSLVLPTIPATISRVSILEVCARLVVDAHRVTEVVITATDVSVTYIDGADLATTVVVPITGD